MRGAEPAEPVEPVTISGIDQGVAGLPWSEITGQLDARGFATIPRLLTGAQCRELVSLYDQAQRFRSRVVMARHGFGRGEYQYFDHPLPDLVIGLRAALYPHLVPVANAWAERLKQDRRFPASLDQFRAECHAAGQRQPTPLLLKYGPDDYNCLHQDLYGDVVFPLQLTVLLSEPATDFTGGEFVLTEQRPRMQSRVEVVPLDRGDAVIFAVNHRPVAGTRGDHRVAMRHGVSEVQQGVRQGVHQGSRFTLGLIFHDAA